MAENFERWIKPCMIWHHRWIGIGLILWGIWHYLCYTSLVSKALYWPIILVIAGVIMLAEVRFWQSLK